MLTWGNSPMANDVPPEWKEKICHATLSVGVSELAGVDNPFEPFERPAGFQVLLEINQTEDAERIFHALAEGGIVKMQMQRTFWGARYGVLVDQFGVPWEVNCAQKD